jgi:hypothetical protein
LKNNFFSVLWSLLVVEVHSNGHCGGDTHYVTLQYLMKILRTQVLEEDIENT